MAKSKSSKAKRCERVIYGLQILLVLVVLMVVGTAFGDIMTSPEPSLLGEYLAVGLGVVALGGIWWWYKRSRYEK